MHCVWHAQRNTPNYEIKVTTENGSRDALLTLRTVSWLSSFTHGSAVHLKRWNSRNIIIRSNTIEVQTHCSKLRLNCLLLSNFQRWFIANRQILGRAWESIDETNKNTIFHHIHAMIIRNLWAFVHFQSTRSIFINCSFRFLLRLSICRNRLRLLLA